MPQVSKLPHNDSRISGPEQQFQVPFERQLLVHRELKVAGRPKNNCCKTFFIAFLSCSNVELFARALDRARTDRSFELI